MPRTIAGTDKQVEVGYSRVRSARRRTSHESVGNNGEGGV
ncbi:MAG: hypothetical protein JWM52_224 [Candidatus Saccharibacteria bacterium]|nr:hypothetical protein [Candidatus Saccharibacteria bacterium]